MAESRSATHLAGKKYTRSHSTVISAAVKPLKALEKLDSVTKISLGVIKPAPSGLIAMKLRDLSLVCVLLTVRGTTSVQQIRIYHEGGREAIEATVEQFRQ